MKFLVLSDTHLQNDLFQAITDHYPLMDKYIHCGDSSLNPKDSLLDKYLVVKGNHDYKYDFDINIIFEALGRRFLITHGNNFNIYFGNDELLAFMKAHDIDVAFHGHTHIPALTVVDNRYIINPGSVMINRGSYGFGTYAIVEINEQINVTYYNSSSYQECSQLVLEDGKKILAEYREILK